MLHFKPLMIALLLVSPVLAQPRDRRPGGDEGSPPMRPPGGPSEFRGPGERGPGEMRGMLSPMLAQVEALKSWIDMVDRYARLARDPAASGIAAVIGTNDLLRNKPDQAIDVFKKMLAESKNESVQRAIRLQLIELYTKTNQPDAALEHLKFLMMSAPPGNPAPPTNPAVPENPPKSAP